MAFVDQAPPAGADAHQLHGRRQYRQALEFELGLHAYLTTAHDRDIERGATHVDADEVGLVGQPAHLPTSDHATNRSRVEGEHRSVGRRVGDHGAAVGLGYVERYRQASVAESLGQPGQVVANPWGDVDGGDSGGGALVLPPFGRHLVAQHDGNVGKAPAKDVPHLEFVQGIDVGVDEGHRHRLVLGLGDGLGRYFDGIDVEWRQLLTGRADPFVDFEDRVPLDQRGGLLILQVVHIGSVAAPDDVGVAVTPGGDQGHLAPGALEEGVEPDRGPVDEERHVFEVGPGPLDRVQDALYEILGRAQNL